MQVPNSVQGAKTADMKAGLPTMRSRLLSISEAIVVTLIKPEVQK